VVQKVVDK